jgi:hypothetical protein
VRRRRKGKNGRGAKYYFLDHSSIRFRYSSDPRGPPSVQVRSGQVILILLRHTPPEGPSSPTPITCISTHHQTKPTVCQPNTALKFPTKTRQLSWQPGTHTFPNHRCTTVIVTFHQLISTNCNSNSNGKNSHLYSFIFIYVTFSRSRSPSPKMGSLDAEGNHHGQDKVANLDQSNVTWPNPPHSHFTI